MAKFRDRKIHEESQNELNLSFHYIFGNRTKRDSKTEGTETRRAKDNHVCRENDEEKEKKGSNQNCRQMESTGRHFVSCANCQQS